MKKRKEEDLPINKAEVLPVQAELITPLAPIQNRQQFIQRMAEQVQSGAMTYIDVARELQITDKQLQFCRNYVEGPTKGSGWKAAATAYGYDLENRTQRQQAYNMSAEYRRGSHPCFTMLQILMDGQGLNAVNLDRNLLDLIEQREHPVASIMALKEANVLMGRTNKKFVEVTVTHKLDYSSLSKSDLKKLIEIGRKAKQIGGEDV